VPGGGGEWRGGHLVARLADDVAARLRELRSPPPGAVPPGLRGDPRRLAAVLLSQGWPAALVLLLPLALGCSAAGAAAPGGGGGPPPADGPSAAGAGAGVCGGGVTFVLWTASLLPLALLLGRVVESLEARVGPAWGGLANATFGNVARRDGRADPWEANAARASPRLRAPAPP